MKNPFCGRRPILILILPLLWLCASARPATAAPDDTLKAQALYDSGMTHYNLGEIQAALDDFTAGYRAYHDSSFLFNIAQCFRRLQKYERAAEFYRTYQREVPSSAHRLDVERLIDEMDRAAAAERAHAASPAPATPAAEPTPPTAEKPPAPPLAVAPASVAQPPARTPLYKRWWLWTAVGAVAAGVAIGVGVGVAARPTTGNVFSPTTIP
jgi:tetratricopeptide (TPR) repeat protein